MNFNQLEWFCHVYESKSIAAAAETAFISRQSLSRSLKNLEEELGVELFVRNDKGIAPTDIADEIYPIVRQCLKNRDDIVEICNDKVLESLPTITIAIAHGMAISLPSGFFGQLSQESPYTKIEIEKFDIPDCLDELEKGLVDFAICPGPIRERNLVSLPILSCPIYLTGTSELIGDPSQRKTLENLQDITFFFVGKNFPADIEFEKQFTSRGLTLKKDDRYHDYDIILHETQKGNRAAIIPECNLFQISDTNLQVIPFPVLDFKFEIDLLYLKRELSPAEQRIVQFMSGMLTNSE